MLANIPILNKRIKFPITPHIPGGFVTPKMLRQISDVAEKYGGTLKIVGSAITIMGLNLSDSEKALAELDMVPESFITKSVRSVSLCPGKPHCPMAQQDSTNVGLALDSSFFGQATPAKVRMGVSGCPNCCAEVFVKDIGLYGNAAGYTLILGGNAGRQARIGRVIATNIPTGRIIEIVGSVIDYYRQHGRDKERLGETLDRIGWDIFAGNVVPAEFRIKE